MPDSKSDLAGLVKDNPAAQVVLDRTLGHSGPEDKSGNALLDAALNDPASAKAMKDATQTMSTIALIGGGYAGAIVGGVVGATLMGIIWAVWPKKGR
jgi:hypothetical protein